MEMQKITLTVVTQQVSPQRRDISECTAYKKTILFCVINNSPIVGLLESTYKAEFLVKGTLLMAAYAE
jgi:hypothetical protein